MSHLMTALAMQQKGLKPATKIVLYWLADHHNGETGQCNPSIKRLAECCEMSRRSVESHIAALEAAGLISVRQCFRSSGGKSANSYSFLLAQSDAQNLRMGSAKSAHGVCAKSAHERTLEDTNLGKEPGTGSDEPDFFLENAEPETQDPPPDKIEDGFNEFWQNWPKHKRKVGKADCLKKYRQACEGKHPKADRIEPDKLNRCAKLYFESVKDHEFLKAPLAWLNQPGWEPFIEQAQQPKRRGTGWLDKIGGY